MLYTPVFAVYQVVHVPLTVTTNYSILTNKKNKGGFIVF